MLKQQVFPMPEAIAYLRAEALVDGPRHAALCRGPEGLPPLVQKLCFQTVLPLADYRGRGGPSLDSGAPVGGQAVFPAAVKDGADTAGETSHGQGNRRNRKHQAAGLRAIPYALGPEVLAGKGSAPVRLDISGPVGKIQGLAVQLQRSAQTVSHADDAVGALHPREKPERPHDVGLESGKWAIAQSTPERKAVPLNLEVDPLTAEAGQPKLDLERLPGDLKLFCRVLQPPRAVVGNDLERRGTASPAVDMEGGNQRESLSLPGLVLEIPALKIGPVCSAEEAHNNSPRIQFPLNPGILYGRISK